MTLLERKTASRILSANLGYSSLNIEPITLFRLLKRLKRKVVMFQFLRDPVSSRGMALSADQFNQLLVSKSENVL